MDLVTTTAVFSPKVPFEKIINDLSAIGFKKLDLAFDYCLENDFNSNNWEKWVDSVLEMAREKGVSFSHAHGIGEVDIMYEDARARVLPYRVIKAASKMGIKYIIMHPYHKGGKDETIEEFAHINAKFFKPFLEECVKYDVHLTLENLPWDNSSKADALVALVEELDSDHVGICWDTGHSHLLKQDVSEVLKLKGHLTTMHAQDNFARGKDEHLIPFDGTYDWKSFISHIKEIGYKGDMVLEAHHQTLEAKNDKERNDLLARLFKVGNYLIEEFEKA